MQFSFKMIIINNNENHQNVKKFQNNIFLIFAKRDIFSAEFKDNFLCNLLILSHVVDIEGSMSNQEVS